MESIEWKQWLRVHEERVQECALLREELHDRKKRRGPNKEIPEDEKPLLRHYNHLFKVCLLPFSARGSL
jgi:hypothetical protein